jgi:Zn-finger nucleic acid-binding protein
MATHAYQGPGNLVIDTCAPCDLIWLGTGELARTVEAPGRDRGTALRGGEGAAEYGIKPTASDPDDDDTREWKDLDLLLFIKDLM